MKQSYKLFLLVLIFNICFVSEKTKGQAYTVENAHSHNDYVNDTPFYRAFNKGFASIEADIFPADGDLLVAHDSVELDVERTLLDMYLKPAVTSLEGSSRRLQLLIDIKKDYPEALRLLVKQLEPYKSLLSVPGRSAALTIVVSGERPLPSGFHHYPDYIWFDGNIKTDYTDQEWKRVGLVSFSFADFSKWDGVGRPAKNERKKLKKVIDRVHKSNKKIRFWAAPDTPSSWLEQMNLGVDLIGTDRIEELATFLDRPQGERLGR